ncbi:MAG: FdrA family protein [Actinomycetota bacterium]|nr:FdrA family protein [Actinomycetota bacterium]
MQASRTVADIDGVGAALIAMATPLNVELAQGMGFEVPPAVPALLLVAIRAEDQTGLDGALAALSVTLSPRHADNGPAADADAPPVTVGAAFAESEAMLALVSVPGPYAAAEAFDAVLAGRNVMIFSDGVSLEDEIALKQIGAESGALVMGPDCGTSIINGIALGFANVVRRGPVGIVAASGTGAQQVSSLLETAGVGVSHLLGLGGRDLSSRVGGLGAELALSALDADPQTERILLVSKPPDPDVAQRLRDLTDGLATPVQFALLGIGEPDLTQAVETVLQALGADPPTWPVLGAAQIIGAPACLHGYFAGGTLAAEALVLAQALGPISSNLGRTAVPAAQALSGDRHIIVDFGDDELTAGRAHPMIDPTLRLDQIARLGTAESDDVVLFLDVVLGYGAEQDPARALVPELRSAAERMAERQAALRVVVSLCGTASDPQGWQAQAQALADAGALVFASNAQAARHAVGLALGTTPDGPP